MSKKDKKRRASDDTTATTESPKSDGTRVGEPDSGTTPESKAERKAAKRAAKEAARAAEAAAKAEKAARKQAEKDAARAAEAEREAERERRRAEQVRAKEAAKSGKQGKAEKAREQDAAQPKAPSFKHLRKKKLASGKGATPREIGESLVSLFNAGKADEAERTWYHRRIESIESDGSVFEGLKGVAEKSAWWLANHTIQSAKAEGPFVCSTGFTVIFSMTVTDRSGARIDFRETGVYTVEKGRIVREQFMQA